MMATSLPALPAYCTIAQCAIWIETRDVAKVEQLEPIPTNEILQELLERLRDGRLTASGLVDGGERRQLDSAEWYDYSIFVLSNQKEFREIFPMRVLKSGSHHVVVRSRSVHPAEAVKNRIGKAIAVLPSRKLVCHRFIEDVLVAGKDLQRELPNIPELRGMKMSEQVRILMDRHRLGPNHNHHTSKVMEDMKKLFDSHKLPILKKGTLERTVRREYDRQKARGK